MGLVSSSLMWRVAYFGGGRWDGKITPIARFLSLKWVILYCAMVCFEGLYPWVKGLLCKHIYYCFSSMGVGESSTYRTSTLLNNVNS